MSMSSFEAVARLTELASDQHGLFTTAQAAASGVPRLIPSRLVERGVLVRVVHGVYAFPAGEDPHRTLRAEWLALEPATSAFERLDRPDLAVVSHTSAATLHGIGDLPADAPEFTLPTRRQSRRAVRSHRAELDHSEIVVRDGLPVTSVERTIADLYRDGHDTSHVADALRDAVVKGRTDLDLLASALGPPAPHAGLVDGVTLVDHLLRLVGLDADSLGDRLSETTVGLALYARGTGDGLQLAVDSLRESARSDPTVSVTEALDSLHRAIASTPALAEPPQNGELGGRAALHTVRLVDSASGLHRRPHGPLPEYADGLRATPARCDD